MKTRPPAVTIGPPRLGVPVLPSRYSLNGAMSSVVPSGTDQRILPVCMSMAWSWPQGGGLHGMPSGDSSVSRIMPNGAPSLGETSLSKNFSRVALKFFCLISVTRCIALDVFT